MKKNILITGASKGIGFSTSEKLTQLGYTVIGIARSKPLTPFPGEFYSCDLSSLDLTEEVLNQIALKHKIDAIVNNVGIVLAQPLGEIDIKSLNAVLDLNVRVAIQVTQKFLNLMKKNKWGRIVNISSRAIFGSKTRTSYSAAKSALIGCTRTWAKELAPFNITVNAVAPGPTETELFRESRPFGGVEEKEVLLSIPLQRFGTPSEIAAAIVFLLSEDAGFITGQTICVDGGGSL